MVTSLAGVAFLDLSSTFVLFRTELSITVNDSFSVPHPQPICCRKLPVNSDRIQKVGRKYRKVGRNA